MRDHAGVKGLQRAELARRTGSNLETVRYYEKVGLLPEPPRTAAGYRNYDTTHERRLTFILLARELGFSLDEIRELLRLVDERNQPCAEASAVAAFRLHRAFPNYLASNQTATVLGARPDSGWGA